MTDGNRTTPKLMSKQGAAVLALILAAMAIWSASHTRDWSGPNMARLAMFAVAGVGCGFAAVFRDKFENASKRLRVLGLFLFAAFFGCAAAVAAFSATNPAAVTQTPPADPWVGQVLFGAMGIILAVYTATIVFGMVRLLFARDS